MKKQFKFEGKGGEFFSILLVNILLSSITLGIYSAWAYVKVRKYLMDNLTLDGKKFSFEGDGGKLFSLWLVQGLLTMITFGIYGAWAMVKIRQYMCENTQYDGKPFEFTGEGGKLFSLMLGQGLLTMITFGIYGAWAHPRIGQARPWVTAVPPWVFLKNLCYHIRSVDTLRFHATILFSGHSGPHRLDVPRVLDVLQPHISTRLYAIMGAGTRESRFKDDKGTGGHAGRGETSMLWAVAPDCVDLSRVPAPDAPGPHFAMGDYVSESDRRAGEQMTADAVAHLGAKVKELLEEHASLKPTHAPLTFDDVEAIWEKEIRPQLKDFASMQDGPDAPPQDSRWHKNWHVPDRG